MKAALWVSLDATLIPQLTEDRCRKALQPRRLPGAFSDDFGKRIGVRHDRLKSLESIRGLGAVIVLFNHLALAFFPHSVLATGLLHHPCEQWFYKTPLGLLVAGRFAVNLFFILSGFVLSFRFLGPEASNDFHLAASVVKRAVRLAPVAVASLILAYALQRAGAICNVEAAGFTGSAAWLAEQARERFDLPTFLRVVLFNPFSSGVALNGPLWTISVELKGSFLVYFLVFALRKSSWRWLFYAVVGVCLRNDLLITFVMGLLLADVYVSFPRFREWPKSGWSASALALAGLVVGSYPYNAQPGALIGWYGSWTRPQLGGESWSLFGAMALMLAVLGSPFLRSVLSCRPGVWLGRISFSLYALHVPLVISVGSGVFLFLRQHLGYLPAAGWAIVTTILLAAGVAELVTRWIDEPSVRWSNRFGVWFMRTFTTDSPEKM